jgi:hypothetical protein
VGGHESKFSDCGGPATATVRLILGVPVSVIARTFTFFVAFHSCHTDSVARNVANGDCRSRCRPGYEKIWLCFRNRFRRPHSRTLREFPGQALLCLWFAGTQLDSYFTVRRSDAPSPNSALGCPSGISLCDAARRHGPSSVHTFRASFRVCSVKVSVNSKSLTVTALPSVVMPRAAPGSATLGRLPTSGEDPYRAAHRARRSDRVGVLSTMAAAVVSRRSMLSCVKRQKAIGPLSRSQHARGGVVHVLRCRHGHTFVSGKGS